MPDYLQRDQAPLSTDQWNALQQSAIQAAGSSLIGRRFLTLVGPFGAGVEVVPNDILNERGGGEVDLLGTSESDAIAIARRTFLPVPLLYKDFWVHWRDVDANQRLGLPLDAGHAAAAASAVANAEDRLILDGDPGLDIPGLRNVPGHQTQSLRDWSAVGNGFADIVDGMRLLLDAGYTGPYALIVSPRLFADLNRLFEGTGVLELQQVQTLAQRGVYPSSVLPDRSAVLVDSSVANVDLAVALDLSLAFLTTEGLNLKLRVLESLVPRIHQPRAIVVLGEGATTGGARRQTAAG